VSGAQARRAARHALDRYAAAVALKLVDAPRR
jgi:hypothetical protein